MSRPARRSRHVVASVTASSEPGSIVPKLIWPAAILALVHQAVALGHDPGYDLGPVYNGIHALIAHRPVYTIPPAWLANPFVYPPSALVILLPLGLIPFDVARILFELVTLVCVLGAGLAMVRLFNHSLSGTAAATVVLILLVSAPAVDGIQLGNLTCVVMLLEVGALWALARSRPGLGGVLLGVSLALKPMLAPFLLLPPTWRKPRAAVLAMVIPCVLSAGALLVMARQPTLLADMLAVTRQNRDNPSNVSLEHALIIIGATGPLRLATEAAVLAATLPLAYAVHRRPTDPLLKAVELSGVVMAAAIVLNPFSWDHYALLLVPAFISVLHPESILRTPVAWLGIALILSPNVWSSHRLGTIGASLDTLRYPLGIGLILAGIGFELLHQRGQSAKLMARA